MRITCPNCNAQYDVSDDMIPSEGRDVQCSNCGTTWFQEGRPRSATAVEERAVRRPGRKAIPPVVEAEEEDFDEDKDDGEEASSPAVRPGAQPRRPEPDQETLDILREERAREERLRDGFAAADARRNQTAEEAAKTDASEAGMDPRTKAAAERSRMAAAASLARARDRGGRSGRTEPPVEEDIDMSDVIAATLREAATPTGEDELDDDDHLRPVDTTPAPSARAARRELLPDIEEINSSLRPDERAAEAEAQANAEAEAPVIARRSSGFRIGFLLVCAVILIFVGLYVFADQVAEALPQVSGALTKYVAWVDTQRVALAAAAEALTESIAPDN